MRIVIMASHEHGHGKAQGDETVSKPNPAPKRSRENTTEEKRNMRKSRKKRLQSQKHVRVLTSKVDEEQKLKEQCQIRALHYRNMARSYWERWQRELRQRKEALLWERGLSQSVASTVHMTNVHEQLCSNILCEEQ